MDSARKFPLISHIFLDIDGVCNNTISETWFDDYNMGNLRSLCDLLGGPKIVLSSDRRRTPQNLAEARANLLGIGLEIFDTTPCHSDPMNRDQEIAEWLAKNEHTACIILDDMESKYVDPELPNVFFFRTQHQFGLTEENVDFIMSYLKGLP